MYLENFVILEMYKILENVQKFGKFSKVLKNSKDLKKKRCLKITSPGRFPSSCLLSNEIPLYKSDIAWLHEWYSTVVLYHL